MVALAVEAWIWYGVALTIVACRFTARLLQFKSVKKLQLEDLCMFLVTTVYTADLILILRAADTPTNLIPPEQLASLTDKDISNRISGSKLIVILEQLFCATQWGCKACLLLLYSNLTVGLRQHAIVKIVAVYTFTGYVVMQILYFAVWCRPFHDYWSVPAASPQCSTYLHHLITNFVVNVSSDILILLIPLPMLAKTQLPLRKKVVLCAVFSVGIFVILSAVLNKYASFTQPYGSLWVYWYVREISTAVIVSNLPHGWALLRRAFQLRSFLHGSEDSRSNPATAATTRTSRAWPGSPELGRGGYTRRLSDLRGFGQGRKERLPSDAESVEVLGSRTRELPLEIWEWREVRCSVEEAKGGGERDGESRERSQERRREAEGVIVIGKGETRTVCEAV